VPEAVFRPSSGRKYHLCVRLPFVDALDTTDNTDSIGPVAQYHENSKYYSAERPAPNKVVDAHLPHITIEMPVYKEDLKQTM
jgi:hypothetical protein